MKRTIGLLITILLFTVMGLVGCGRGQTSDINAIGIDLSVSPDPPAVGPATLVLTLTDEQGQPISGAELELEGNMSHAGMTPVFSQAQEVEPGRYEAPLEFTMGGDWFVLVKATLPDGRALERQIDVPGVSGGM
ncbi:MAG: FixH family protein [Anaerolineae bacterium]|nr:FixH family protein [Anaerolineae bacterium]